MTDQDKELYLSTRMTKSDDTVGGKSSTVEFYFKVYKTDKHKWDNVSEYLFQSLIKQGVSIKDAATRVGVSYSNAKVKIHRLKQAGFDCGDLKKRWNKEKVVILVYFKDNLNYSDKDIADAMGHTLASVKSKIKEIRDGRKTREQGFSLLPDQAQEKKEAHTVY